MDDGTREAMAMRPMAQAPPSNAAAPAGSSPPEVWSFIEAPTVELDDSAGGGTKRPKARRKKAKAVVEPPVEEAPEQQVAGIIAVPSAAGSHGTAGSKANSATLPFVDPLQSEDTSALARSMVNHWLEDGAAAGAPLMQPPPGSPSFESVLPPASSVGSVVREATGSAGAAASVASHAADDADEEPLYVNAKQYHRILKRRAARARILQRRKREVIEAAAEARRLGLEVAKVRRARLLVLSATLTGISPPPSNRTSTSLGTSTPCADRAVRAGAS